MTRSSLRWLRDRLGDCTIAVITWVKVVPYLGQLGGHCWAALKCVWAPVYRFAVGG